MLLFIFVLNEELLTKDFELFYFKFITNEI